MKCRLLYAVFHVVYLFLYRRAQGLNFVLSLWCRVVFVCVQYSKVLSNIAEELIRFHDVVSIEGSITCPCSARGVLAELHESKGGGGKSSSENGLS